MALSVGYLTIEYEKKEKRGRRSRRWETLSFLPVRRQNDGHVLIMRTMEIERSDALECTMKFSSIQNIK